MLRIYAIPPTTTARIRQAITTGKIGLRVLTGLGARFLRSLILSLMLLLALSSIEASAFESFTLSSIEASVFESVTLSSTGASGFTSVELSLTLSICALVLLLPLFSIEVSTFTSVTFSSTFSAEVLTLSLPLSSTEVSDFTSFVLSSDFIEEVSSETFVKKRLLIASSVATFCLESLLIFMGSLCSPFHRCICRKIYKLNINFKFAIKVKCDTCDAFN